MNNLSDAQLITLLQDPKFTTIIFALAIWELIWKGIALWKASKNNSMPWFIAILVINTVGILPIVYIFFFANKKEK